MEQEAGLAIPREVNVYVTSRLNERGEKSAITLRRGIIIAGCLFVDYRSPEYSIERALLSAAPVARRAINIYRRRVIISNRRTRRTKAVVRNRTHGANVTRNRKNAYQSRDTTSIRIFRLIPPVISLNKHCGSTRIIFARSLAIKNCIPLLLSSSLVRIIPVAQPHRCNGKIIPDTIYDVREIHSFSVPPFPSTFCLQKRRRDGKYFTREINEA